MKVLVVGAGAVGSWIGGHMAAGGADVSLVDRKVELSTLREEGLTLVAPDRVTRVRPSFAPAITDAWRAALDAGTPFEIVVVAVKSYHTDSVASELDELILAHDVAPRYVMCVQNGVGNEERLSQRLGAVPVVPATLTSAVSVGPLGTVTSNGKGGVGLAPACPLESVARVAAPRDADGPDRSEGPCGPSLGGSVSDAGVAPTDMLGLLAQGGLTVRAYDSGARIKWSKLLLNILGSATSAVLGWPSARVFADRSLFAIEHAAWLEALAVVGALGLRPVALPGYPVPLMARAASTVPERFSYRLFAGRLAAGRGDRLPGTAVDLVSGMGRTEVDVLGGAVAAAGDRVGEPAPVNRALTELVAAIASGDTPREAFADRPDALVRELHDALARSRETRRA